MMLECDGPDVDGAVALLVGHDIVSHAWVERLTAINQEWLGLYDEELVELREGLSDT